jgi:hypothetical protein
MLIVSDLVFCDNQAYHGDHWLFTNIERKATLDINILYYGVHIK